MEGLTELFAEVGSKRRGIVFQACNRSSLENSYWDFWDYDQGTTEYSPVKLLPLARGNSFDRRQRFVSNEKLGEAAEIWMYCNLLRGVSFHSCCFDFSVSVLRREKIHGKHLILWVLSCFVHQAAFCLVKPSSGSPLFNPAPAQGDVPSCASKSLHCDLGEH